MSHETSKGVSTVFDLGLVLLVWLQSYAYESITNFSDIASKFTPIVNFGVSALVLIITVKRYRKINKNKNNEDE